MSLLPYTWQKGRWDLNKGGDTTSPVFTFIFNKLSEVPMLGYTKALKFFPGTVRAVEVAGSLSHRQEQRGGSQETWV